MGDERFINDGWSVVPRGDVAPHWSGLYVTINPRGRLHMSRPTWERLGSPAAFRLLYNQAFAKLKLVPAGRDEPHAYPAGVSGKFGGKVIRAGRLLTQFNVRPQNTFEFDKPRIDEDGALVVDFKNLRISMRCHSVCRDRQPTWKW